MFFIGKIFVRRTILGFNPVVGPEKSTTVRFLIGFLAMRLLKTVAVLVICLVVAREFSDRVPYWGQARGGPQFVCVAQASSRVSLSRIQLLDIVQ